MSRLVGRISPYYLYLIFVFLTRIAFAFSFGTYVLFLLSRGATLFEVGLINTSFMVAIAIAEIPTGLFADHFGRKKSFVISNLVMGAGLLIYFFSGSLAAFLAAEILAGIGLTFRSGALEAWVVDSVAESGQAIDNRRIFSMASIIENFAGIIGGLAGAYLGSADLAYPWLAGAILLGITFIMSLILMRENKISRSNIESGHLSLIGKTAITAIKITLKNKIIMILLLASLILSFVFQPLNMYWQPRFSAMSGERVWIMGWIWVVISLALITGNIIARRARKDIGRHRILAASAVIIALPIVLAAVIERFVAALALFCLYEIGRGVNAPVHLSYLNDEIPSAERATIISIEQMFVRIGGVIGLLTTGALAQTYSISLAWLISGLVALSAIPLYMVCRK